MNQHSWLVVSTHLKHISPRGENTKYLEPPARFYVSTCLCKILWVFRLKIVLHGSGLIGPYLRFAVKTAGTNKKHIPNMMLEL